MLGFLRPSVAGRRLLVLLGTVLLAAGLISVVAADSSAAASPTPIGRFEHLTAVAGGIQVSGWTFEPDIPHLTVTIAVNVDGVGIGTALAKGTRTDVGKVYPAAGPSHGYSANFVVASGTHSVCVYAYPAHANTARPSLGCRTITIASSPIGGLSPFYQVPQGVHVVGWTLDPDTTGSLPIDVWADGSRLSLGSANVTRTDIQRAYPKYGAAHGFDIYYVLPQGSHQICVYAGNVGPGAESRIGCQTVNVNYNPDGRLDTVRQVSGGFAVTGWSFDRDTTGPVQVNVLADGTKVGTLTANGSRPDVAAAYPTISAAHGYSGSFPLAEGTHSICVQAVNVGRGANSTLPCRPVTLNYSPTGDIETLVQTAGGFQISGAARDPDAPNQSISVTVYDNGVLIGRPMTANAKGSTQPGHGYSGTYAAPRQGTHQICVTGINVGPGANRSMACRSISLNFNPDGRLDTVARAKGSANIAVTGWAIDPDTSGQIKVSFTIDGKAAGMTTANTSRPDVAAVKHVSALHGYSTTLTANAGEHVVCATAVNVTNGSGNTLLPCKTIYAVHPSRNSPPQKVTATAGYGSATVTWAAPASDGGYPATSYMVWGKPGIPGHVVPASQKSYTFTGLKPGVSYVFVIYAINPAGQGPGGGSNTVRTLVSPPPQTTPAPISTSRYVRNISGAASDAATMRAEGATDAAHNPSGHSYLVLLDIGGQDYAGQGVVLSATTRWVSDAALVTAVNAYVDGYASRQLTNAPVTIAVGTNNDMDVSSSAGSQWARSVVNPIATYAARHPNLTVAGANDIEPGFSANATSSKAWLTGYLAATTHQFVFNGSADGCNWSAVNGRCNNGWAATDLQWLAGGAASTRIINMPQIYNTTMAQQWKFISLTGVVNKKAKINFGGPLTEYTACQQAGSCGSLTGNEAWNATWSALRSDSRISQPSLPHSTDLRIN